MLAGSQVQHGIIPVPGVEVGELLGKGSYGQVFRGSWYGKEVAVKVHT
jgi:predicted Ser/Thr protein kinase